MFRRTPKQKAGRADLALKATSFKKKGAVTVLSIEGDIVRAVQASAQGDSAKVTRLASAKLEVTPEKGKSDTQARAAALKKALEKMRIKSKEVLFALPRRELILRPLQVPMVADSRELASLVNFQIAKDLPFRLEEAVVDFKVLRVIEPPAADVTAPKEDAEKAQEDPAAKPQPKLELLVGAVKQEIVRDYTQIAEGAGLKIAALGLRSTGNAHGLLRANQVEPQSASAIISVAHDEITIDIITQTGVVFSRVAAGPPASSIAAEDGQASEADRSTLLNNLVVEVVRSLHSYEGMMLHKLVQKIFVVGDTGLEAEITRLIGAKLNLPTAQLDPASSFIIPSKDQPEAAGAFALIGLAFASLLPAGLPIDFANPKKPAVQRNTQRIQLLAAAALVMILLFGALGVRSHLLKKRTAIRDAAQVELTDAEKKLPIYKRLKAQTKVVNGWIQDEQNWLDHLAYLSAILPPADQLYVNAINTTPQHVIRISLQAKSGELLAELDKKLRAAGYEVKPLSITPANDKHGYNFRTTVELNVPTKLKPDINKVKPPPPRPEDDASLSARSPRSTRLPS